MIVPGYFPQNGPVGWGMWLTETLMQRTLISTYPIYASCITPWFMRLLGAKVGRNVEISTAETIPHLTTLKDGSFLADHALVTSHRAGFGWLHIGTSVIGERTFVGNSGIVGPDRDLPADALVAVLSSAPHRAPAGSSWLGRTAAPIARAKTAVSYTHLDVYKRQTWARSRSGSTHAWAPAPWWIPGCTWVPVPRCCRGPT